MRALSLEMNWLRFTVGTEAEREAGKQGRSERPRTLQYLSINNS